MELTRHGPGESSRLMARKSRMTVHQTCLILVAKRRVERRSDSWTLVEKLAMYPGANP